MNRGELASTAHDMGGRAEGVYQEIMNDARLRKLAVSIVAVLDISIAAAGLKQIDQYDDTRQMASAETVVQGESSLLRLAAGSDYAQYGSGQLPKEPALPVAHTAIAKPSTYEEVFEPSELDISAELPKRRLPYEAYAREASGMISRLPSLDTVDSYFSAGGMTENIKAQKEYIQLLDLAVTVSPEKYKAFAVDSSRHHAFADLPNYHKKISPKMFIVHWTGMGYTDVDQFTKSLKPNRVQYFIDANARTYQLFESDNNMPAHALGANAFSQGVEIETGEYDGVNSPLFSYTPAQIENTVYLAVQFLRRNNLPVDETTLVSHYAADLIFTNPYYNPHTGKFSKKSIRKFDPPEELMKIIVSKAHDLNHALELGR